MAATRTAQRAAHRPQEAAAPGRRGVFQPVERACPLCRAGDGELLAQVAQDVCGVGRISFGVRACAGCGMILQAPMTDPAAIETQYRAFSNYTFTLPDQPPLQPPGRRIIAALEAAGARPGRAFDVGAATGDFLWHLRERGWAVAGCDPSPNAAAAGRQRYGIEIRVGTEQSLLGRQSGLSLVTFSHVLEHLADPVASLIRAHGALADEGRLAFEFPCFTDVDAMPPGVFMMEHLNYFTRRTTEQLLARAGFEPLSMTVDFWERHYPVITVVARKARGRTRPVGADSGGAALCRDYLAMERERLAGIDARIERAITGAPAIFIWGAGLHTSLLLERCPSLARVSVVAVMDRDAQKAGHRLGPHRVSNDVGRVSRSAAPVVISSQVSEREIARALADQGVAPERIVTLYD